MIIIFQTGVPRSRTTWFDINYPSIAVGVSVTFHTAIVYVYIIKCDDNIKAKDFVDALAEKLSGLGRYYFGYYPLIACVTTIMQYKQRYNGRNGCVRK